jgi:hypothetical protein
VLTQRPDHPVPDIATALAFRHRLDDIARKPRSKQSLKLQLQDLTLHLLRTLLRLTLEVLDLPLHRGNLLLLFQYPDLQPVLGFLFGLVADQDQRCLKSKRYRASTRSDWDNVRVNIMRWCLRVNLAQNWSTFGALLRKTGDRPIVEQSRKDEFWGAKPQKDGTLVGINVRFVSRICGSFPAPVIFQERDTRQFQ